MINLLEIQDNNTLEYHNIKVNKFGIEYEKNWGNQDRNMVGSIRGTLIGLSTNITATSDYLDQNHVEELSQLLNQSYFSVKFYDVTSNTVKTADYTASNVSVEMIRLVNKQYAQVEFTLVAVDMWVS